MAEQSLYERLGGVFAIAAVVDHFSDAVVKDRVAGQGSDNPALREWHTQQLARLPGLKWMRTLWLCDVAGGPFSSTSRPSPDGDRSVSRRRIETSTSRPRSSTPSRRQLASSLDAFHVPAREKDEVLAAFAAHKGEVTEGSMAPA